MNQPLHAQHAGVPRFEPKALAGELSPAAVSYFSFSIQPGTPLAGTAELVFAGRVRLKPGTGWLPFRATETIHAGRSFRITARARRGPFTAVVADSYWPGQAWSQVRAFGVIPVRVRRGADLARSARGRLVAESVWLPPAFLPGYRVRWSGGSRDTARLTVPVDGHDIEARVQLGSLGELVQLDLPRWSNLTSDGSYGWVPFRARCHQQRCFGGYTIPSAITAIMAAGTSREFEFLHASVQQARFLP